MSTVLHIEELTFAEDGRLVVDAVVDDMVVLHAQTQLEPAEWGPALCRGTVYLSDEDLIPPTDSELCKLLSELIDDWVVLDSKD